MLELILLVLLHLISSGSEELVPVQGQCPTCGKEELWGDLIKKKRGCYSHVEEVFEEEEEDDL